MHLGEDMAARHGAMLGELAGLGMDLARGLKARADAAQSDAEAERLAGAFHQIARDVRLTLALEAKLAREHAAAQREAAARVREQVRARVRARKAEVAAVISPLLWRECEGEAAEDLAEDVIEELYEDRLVELDERLERQAAADDFLDQPLEACVARIRAEMGLPADDAPQAAAPEPAEAGWRSSA